MRDRTEDVNSVVQQYNQFELIPLRIENAFDHRWWENVGGKPRTSDILVDMRDEGLLLFSVIPHSLTLQFLSKDLFFSCLPETSDDPVADVRSYIAGLPTQTAVSSAIQTLIRLLILHTAHSTNSSHVVLGTSLTSLSINLISSISQGGGFVAHEEAEEDWVPPNVVRDPERIPSHSAPQSKFIRIIRPLRDVGRKECAAWTWWSGVKVIGSTNIPVTKQAILELTKGTDSDTKPVR
jgi:cytoplasmic tRNA 2-thiolation protein 2